MATIQNTNHPGEFRRTLPSGAEIWGPARITRGQNTMLSSVSRPPTEMPNGEYRRFFDLDLLTEELLILFAESPDSGWTIKTQDGQTLEMARSAIREVDILDSVVNQDLSMASVELLAHFYPQYQFLLPAKAEDVGEEPGSPESEPTPKTGAKATSGK